jgi:hypothetical protein
VRTVLLFVLRSAGSLAVMTGVDRALGSKAELLDGEYVGLDRTASRLSRRVGVYMGTNVAKARQLGVRRLRISWCASAAGKTGPTE